MSKNLVSVSWSPEQLLELDAALSMVEAILSGLVSLSGAQRRDLFKMGEKSEMFCRQTLHVLQQNQRIVPESLGLPEAIADLAALDALRPRLVRLKQLASRGESTELALGSDIFGAALEGYAQLKVSGKSHGLEGLRRELSSRFAKRSRAAAPALAAELAEA
jgi:hypothetical protein